MQRYFFPYAATTAVMFAVDMLWLGVVAKPLYERGLGHLLAAQPNLLAALLFYLVYPAGLMVFAVRPSLQAGTLRPSFIAGGMFGFFAYATYDLTNLATLNDWPVGLSMLDIAWGAALSAVASAAGAWTQRRFSR